jgi:hypothetical protein
VLSVTSSQIGSGHKEPFLSQIQEETQKAKVTFRNNPSTRINNFDKTAKSVPNVDPRSLKFKSKSVTNRMFTSNIASGKR